MAMEKRAFENIPRIEHRAVARDQYQMFVRIKPLDEPQEESMIALTVELSATGLTLLSYMPLPTGSRILIDNGANENSIGEVIDWEWDYCCDMARMGVKFIEKRGIWPKAFIV
jgi:hypothetical protein